MITLERMKRKQPRRGTHNDKFTIYNKNGELKRRFQIFEVCCDYADDHNGNSPSVREIADILLEDHGIEISHTTVYHHLRQLEEFGGYVERKDDKLVIYRSKWIRPPQLID